MSDNNGSAQAENVDWSRFGLADNVEHSMLYVNRTTKNENGNEQNHTKHVREIFDEEGDLSEQKPWWKANFFVTEPVLFGTWDGVFTSCMLNIFGVVIFLRTGWTVGNAGIALTMFIVFLTLLISLVPVLSSIGIIDHIDHIESGGIYFVLTHILGARIGATVAILYCFGQAASISLFSSGFGESLAQTTHWDNHWAARTIALIATLVILTIILTGVKWVVKLQLLLLAVLAISVLDFVIGTFAHTDIANGFTGYKEGNMMNNINPKFSADQTFFSIFGVFFSTATGIMAGINMSGDLKNPGENIPTGTLAALGVSGILYMLFALLLGAVCTREALLNDYMIASKRGANQEPYVASLFVGFIAIILILIGNVNSLAPVVTMPFLMTYAAVNYAYFKLIMCKELHKRRKLLEEGLLIENSSKKDKTEESHLVSKTDMTDGKNAKDYGTSGDNALLDGTEKCDIYDNEILDRKSTLEENKGIYARYKGTNVDNVGTNLGDLDKDKDNLKDNNLGFVRHNNSQKIADDDRNHQEHKNEGEMYTDDNYCELHDKEETELYSKVSVAEEKNGGNVKRKLCYPKSHFTVEIEQKRITDYSQLANRWISLAGAVASVLIMFLIHWGYALANISAALIIYIYIGQTNPGVTKGIAYDFNFAKWLQSLWDRLTRRSPNQHQIVKFDAQIPYDIELYQVTEENSDFSNRERRHHSSIVKVIVP